MPQAAVSQQLARLRFDRLVQTRRDGRMVYYSIASEAVAQLVELLYRFFCKPALEENRKSSAVPRVKAHAGAVNAGGSSRVGGTDERDRLAIALFRRPPATGHPAGRPDPKH